MDYSHFPFVHPNLLAPPDQTLVPDAEIEQTEYGLKYQYETVEPESPSSKEGDVVVFEYYLYFPFMVHVKKVTPDGGETYVSLLTSPQQHNLTTLYIIFVRNYALDTPDDSFDHFSNRVLEHDRRIVESQRPEQLGGWCRWREPRSSRYRTMHSYVPSRRSSKTGFGCRAIPGAPMTRSAG